MQLALVKGGEEIVALAMSAAPRHLGRAPDCDLVLSDSTVSTRHATVWVEAGRGWLRDLGSRNGTFVDGDRIRGAVEIHDGQSVQLGSGPTLVVRGQPVDGVPQATALLVEDVELGVRYPFDGDRFRISSAPAADLRLDEEDEHDALLSLHLDEVWLATLDGDVHLDIGQEFALAGRRLRVLRVPATYTPTVEAERARFPYRLRVTLNGVSGPEAVVHDVDRGVRHVVEAENRAVLLWVLARQVVDARKRPDGAGDTWCPDDDVVTGIWGKKGASDGNSLHVLVHRLRKELKKAGFDPWFIEKRRKAIRLALSDVVVDEG